MARNDLLINLVRAGAQGDQLGFRRTVEAMVAEERERQHHVVADRLAEFLHEQQWRLADTDAHSGAVTEITPHRALETLFLPDGLRSACLELVEEQQRADVLRSHSVEPRNRVLLAGPPGNGKTSLAEAIAGELNVSLLAVRYEAVVASYLGETAVRLSRLFDQVRTRRCVLFFDEFDAIGKERGDEHETGEIKRVVSSLLLNIDALPSYVVVVVATNHPELLDRAVWRRFQLRLALPPPRSRQVVEYLARFQTELGSHLGLSLKQVSDSLRDASFAELEEFCEDVRRRVILAGPAAKVASIVRTRLAQWKERSLVHG